MSTEKTKSVVCILGAILSLIGIVLKYDLIFTAVRYSLTVLILMTASVCDIRKHKIPDWCVAVTAVLSLLRIIDGSGIPEMFTGCIPAAFVYIIILVFESFKGRKVMGRGDIKLLFALGLHFGLFEMLYIILAALIIAAVYFLIFIRNRMQGIALCPMLLAGVIITLLAM